MRRAKLLATAALLLGLTAGPAGAQQAPFDGMAVFGDSLSDDGNVALSLGLPRQRFTTNPGLVAAEDLAAHYGLSLSPSVTGGNDYAFGGAGLIQNTIAVPTVTAQITGYLTSHATIGRDTLVSLWGGNNDVFVNSDAISAGTETVAQGVAQLTAAAQLEGDLIGRLQAAGARRVIVFNLPDIGVTPGGAPQDTAMVQAFNATLNARLAGRTGVVAVDMYGLLHEVAANPAAYGFADATTPACTVSPALLCTPATLVAPNAASTHVFADDVHPTSAAHLALAEALIGELNAPGQMSLLAEAPLALLRGHRAAVDEELARETAKPGWTLFATGRDGRGRFGGDWAVATAHADEGAVTLGGVWRTDGVWGGALALGGALSIGESRVRLDQGLGGFDAKQIAATAFGRYGWANGSWASLQAGLSHADYDDIRRGFAIGPARRAENSTGNGQAASVEVAAGRWFRIAGLRTGPFATFAYDHVRVGDVVERGGDSTAMWFAGQRRDASTARVGWKLEGATTLAGYAVQPIASVAYAHDFDADRREVSAGLATLNGEFSMPGYQPSRNWGEANLGLSADLGGGFRGKLAYEGLFGDRGRENLGVVGISLSF